MELHTAIRNIVNLSGNDILKEKRVVNILSDFNAYEVLPSAKFVLKNIIEEGFMTRFLELKEWSLECDKLIDYIISSTGIQPDLVRYVFQCIAFGIGWQDDAPQNPKSNNLPVRGYSSQTTSNNHKQLDLRSCSDEEIETYLLSLIQWSFDPKEYGIEIDGLNFSIWYRDDDDDDDDCFGVTCRFVVIGELLKDLKLKGIEYNNRGGVSNTFDVATLRVRGYKNYKVIEAYWSLKYNVGKIVLAK